MPEQQPQRVIAIVGRPNVGKSALFNRLVGRRVSIVHEQSGVTRDRISCEAVWNDEPYELIDTGGVGRLDAASSADVIEEGTRRQVDLAIQDATVVIFVVDLQHGITPLDREVSRLLHESGRAVFVAANKADEESKDGAALEFEELGFPVFPVSALHNRGVGELMDRATARLPEAALIERLEQLNIAVVGRPNVGKSSYINRLLKSDRVIVSSVPGTTRDSIEVPFSVGKGEHARHYRLIDTAGVRKSSKVKEAVDKFSMIRTEESIKKADVVIIMLDASEGPTQTDKKMASIIEQEKKGCLLLVNKWDLAQEEGITQRAYGKSLREALPFMDHVPIIFTSAQSGYNIRQTLEAVNYVADQVRAVLSTGLLNRVLRDACARVQAPLVQGRRLKVYYAVQVGKQPICVRLFVNSPRRIKPAYQSYLIRAIRDAFGLEGAPILLQLRAHRQ